MWYYVIYSISVYYIYAYYFDWLYFLVLFHILFFVLLFWIPLLTSSPLLRVYLCWLAVPAFFSQGDPIFGPQWMGVLHSRICSGCMGTNLRHTDAPGTFGNVSQLMPALCLHWLPGFPLPRVLSHSWGVHQDYTSRPSPDFGPLLRLPPFLEVAKG